MLKHALLFLFGLNTVHKQILCGLSTSYKEYLLNLKIFGVVMHKNRKI